MNRWFTSDHHFGHVRILRFRPKFTDIFTMNDGLAAAWNSRVKRDDVVYHLGDFLWKGPRPGLNGHIVHILGNHDKRNKLSPVHDVLELKINDQKIFLSHYAHRVWPSSHHGAWHLYGHSHGNLADDPNALSMDVGVDCHPEFAPFGLDEIQAHMSKKTFVPVDHHGSFGRERS